MDKSSQIEYWNLSDSANIGAMKANDSRAKTESSLAPGGELLTKVHAEALRDYKDLEKLVLGGVAFLRSVGLPFTGDAADLGSGTGVGATMISRIPETQRIYAVEYSEQFVKNIMPIVFSHFQADEGKIVRVVGDFNTLKLNDNSLSLILEIDAFHHSENLERTLRECCRILKPGGVIISVDRAWPDSVSREELDRKLEVEYSDARKALFGIPPRQSYRRRDNGEHEYTIKDWLSFYKSSGFDANVFTQVHPPKLNSLLLGPFQTFKFSIFVSSLFYRLGRRRHWIYGFGPTRKLFVAIKKGN